ncbi:MAG: glutamate synthase central domain-containing protein, partial [Thermomicrobiales bacterium]
MSLAPINSRAPLYDPAYEHDACGVGLVVDVEGRASRSILDRALAGLVNLTHRGGVGADARTGDGAGVLTQIPHQLYADHLNGIAGGPVAPGDLGVAMVFLPTESDGATRCRAALEAGMADRDLPVLGWREVPIEPEVLGPTAVATLPRIEQLFIRRPEDRDGDTFERDLMLARKHAERKAGTELGDCAVVSCSSRTVVYKGFCLPEDLSRFYADLRDPRYETAIALFHQRYSTNTFPTWALAQPFRFLAHNGEINTVQGNRNWMQARRPKLSFNRGLPAEALEPVVSLSGSDSLSLDNVLELLYRGGRSLPHSLMMLVPEPWEQLPEMPADLRPFYDFHAGLMEQWDGPAALAFSDGIRAGATLDRNGLRPLRWALTSDGLFVAGSEAGTVELDQSKVIEKGRLGPGQMILVDTERGVVLRNDELKAEVAATSPYADWLAEHRVTLDLPAPELAAVPDPEPEAAPAGANGKPVRAKADPETVALQRSYGYTAEDLRLILHPMAGEAKEPTWSMGDDAPLAVLSERVRPLSSYFRQRFAQVTNPAIDSLRERRIMALDAHLGPRGNMLAETPEQARLVHLSSIVLSEDTFMALAALKEPIRAVTLSTLFAADAPEGALSTAFETFLADAGAAVRDGAGLLVLSDRGVDANHVSIPMVLAVGALHHSLIRDGLRLDADIVVETGEVWDVHQLGLLIGYGASAVHPYLALQASAELAGTRGFEQLSGADLRRNYLAAMENGFLKVSSKMGISTASGYHGAQIFETIGLDRELVNRHFTGTPARLGGIGLNEIEVDVRGRHAAAYEEMTPRLPDLGLIRFRKDGESHGYNPTLVTKLQEAVRDGGSAAYAEYRDLVKGQAPTAVRDLLDVKPIGPAVPLDEVEPADAILGRFVVTAMSLGALSPEAYRTLA